jgi:PadR family transcriptional regulator, regulatory protein PadR
MNSEQISTKNSEWLRGVLDLCTLSLLTGRDRYGYEIAKVLEDAGLGPIKGGTLYPLLARLEESGFVSTTWKPGDRGPGRKYYRLTDRGRDSLRVSVAAWREFVHRAVSVMEGELP